MGKKKKKTKLFQSDGVWLSFVVVVVPAPANTIIILVWITTPRLKPFLNILFLDLRSHTLAIPSAAQFWIQSEQSVAQNNKHETSISKQTSIAHAHLSAAAEMKEKNWPICLLPKHNEWVYATLCMSHKC